MKPTMPPEVEELKAEKARLWSKVGDVGQKIGALRREAFAAAGWKPCCRCYPGAVDDDGFCGCCLYNHDTGVSMEFKDLDYDGEGGSNG